MEQVKAAAKVGQVTTVAEVAALAAPVLAEEVAVAVTDPVAAATDVVVALMAAALMSGSTLSEAATQ